MLDEKFYERKELIIRNNELNKNFDEKNFKKNINKKIELEQKLESISITSDVLASGKLARKNVLNSAVKPASTYSYVNDVVIEDSSKESKSTINKKARVNLGFNRGKEIVEGIRKKDSKQDKFSI